MWNNHPLEKPEILNQLKVWNHIENKEDVLENFYVDGDVAHFHWIFSYGIWSRAQITMKENNRIEFQDKGGPRVFSFLWDDYNLLPNKIECQKRDFNYSTVT